MSAYCRFLAHNLQAWALLSLTYAWTVVLKWQTPLLLCSIQFHFSIQFQFKPFLVFLLLGLFGLLVFPSFWSGSESLGDVSFLFTWPAFHLLKAAPLWCVPLLVASITWPPVLLLSWRCCRLRDGNGLNDLFGHCCEFCLGTLCASPIA